MSNPYPPPPPPYDPNHPQQSYQQPQQGPQPPYDPNQPQQSYQQPYQQIPQYYPQPPYYYPQPPTNGKAVASMVLGILSVMIYFTAIVLGPIAIIMARRAKDEILQTNERGEGLATAGMVTGIVGLCFFVLAAIFFIIMISLTARVHSY